MLVRYQLICFVITQLCSAWTALVRFTYSLALGSELGVQYIPPPVTSTPTGGEFFFTPFQEQVGWGT